MAKITKFSKPAKIVNFKLKTKYKIKKKKSLHHILILQFSHCSSIAKYIFMAFLKP